jgi:mannose-1-phosphate guanylyltransferase
MNVYERLPNSTVVIFPSDHFILEEKHFMDQVELACQAVEQNSSWLVLLGVQPSEPECDYGYIVPGSKRHRNLHEVRRFIEKPKPDAALNLLREGGLWNTMVMIFKAKTMVELVCQAAPKLHRVFANILGAIGTTHEVQTINEAYRQMDAVNFSKGLLEYFSVRHASRLMVLPVRDVYWSDWGSEQRILRGLKMAGSQEPRRGAKENKTRKLDERNSAVPSVR